MDILEAYILKKPSEQNVLDLFQGEWSSKLPDEYDFKVEPGAAIIFEDTRVVWAEEVFGSFAHWNILELGPLEGGHSYMFQERKVNSVVAIEANTRSFLKCLCIKEIFQLDKINFRLGDFMLFLEDQPNTYDLVFASGVLYHMEEPLKLLENIAKVSPRLFIWTHHYEHETIQNCSYLKPRFGPLITANYGDFSYEYAVQEYQQTLNWIGFCGGPQPVSKWLTKQSILDFLKKLGYNSIEIGFDDLNHPNGPAFAVCAVKDEVQFEQKSYHERMLDLQMLVDKQKMIADMCHEMDAMYMTILQKNEHIAKLEMLIKQLESGKMMQAFKWINQFRKQ